MRMRALPAQSVCRRLVYLLTHCTALHCTYGRWSIAPQNLVLCNGWFKELELRERLRAKAALGLVRMREYFDSVA